MIISPSRRPITSKTVSKHLTSHHLPKYNKEITPPLMRYAHTAETQNGDIVLPLMRQICNLKELDATTKYNILKQELFSS